MARKTAAELIEALGWTRKDLRSPYDSAVFATLEALERELREAHEEIASLREEVAHALINGGTLA